MFIKMLADPGDQPDWFGTSRAEMAATRGATSRLRPTGPEHVDIEIRGHIDRELFDRVKSELDAAPYANTINIQIDSHGGYVLPSVDLFIVIDRHPAEKKIARLRQCASGAALVAMAADIRIAAPGCEILLHPSTMALVDDGRRYTAEELEHSACLMRMVDADILTVIAQRTGADPAALAAEAATEFPAALEWCRAHNLVHQIEVSN